MGQWICFCAVSFYDFLCNKSLRVQFVVQNNGALKKNPLDTQLADGSQWPEMQYNDERGFRGWIGIAFNHVDAPLIKQMVTCLFFTLC